MTLLLTVTAIVMTWKYTAVDENMQSDYDKLMSPTMKYFDANRDAKPLLEIKVQDPTKASLCGTGWEEENTLYNWPGTKTGCLKGDKISTGKCTSSSNTGIHS